MSNQTLSSNRASLQVGFWSVLLIALAFVIFTVCFVCIGLNPPLYTWTDLAGYVLYAHQHSQLLQEIARFTMLLFGPLYVILLNCIYEQVPQEKKFLARIAVDFGLAFAVLTGINYFVQLSAVRLSLIKGQLQGLEQIVQANPISGISAINLLGWTLFLGLSSLFVASVFSSSRLEKAIAIAFIVNGLCCLLGGMGYVLDNPVIVFLTLDLGMGGAVLTASVLLCIYYRKIITSSRPISA